MSFGAGELGVVPATASCGLSRPVHFKRTISGNLQKAWFDHTLKQPPARARKQSKRLGLSYEKKVSAHISLVYPSRWFPQGSFKFTDSSGSHLAFIDGLFFSADWKSVTLVEIKLRHSADAYHQLWNFYRLIVSKAWPGLEINCLEICRWYDPGIILPKKVAFAEAVHQAGGFRHCFHPIHIMRLT